MARVSIPVDLFNPGQVFACIGLIEAAEQLTSEARGAFDWSDAGAPRFDIECAGDESPVAMVLRFLADADIGSLAPAGTTQSTAKWNIPTIPLLDGAPYPFPLPDTPATLPAILSSVDGTRIVIDHWGEAVAHTGRDAVKFWAGAGGYPGAALTKDAIDLVRGQIATADADPFSISAPQSGSFRFDWRRDYIPIDAGFSPNKHSALTMLGYPLVELLAAIGLSNARPKRIDRLAYRYAAIAVGEDRELLDPSFLRAALGASELPFPRRVFKMELGWPGQEGQARCITNVIEEP
jgi:CRISPR-associated protein Csx14